MNIIKYMIKVVDEDNTRFFDYLYLKFGAWFALFFSTISLIFAMSPNFGTPVSIQHEDMSFFFWAVSSFSWFVIFLGINKKVN